MKSILLALLFCIPAIAAKPAKVLVFGAPWCHYCHEQIPIAEKALKDHGVIGQVVVVTGNSSSSHPSDVATAAYKADLGSDLEFVSDPWRWQTYHQYFPGQNSIPAAVALDASGKVIKFFYPGLVGEGLERWLDTSR